VEIEVLSAEAEIELRAGGRTVRLERGAAARVWVGTSKTDSP
jgi:hypothetical protein